MTSGNPGRAITSEDLYRIAVVSDPQVAPDGSAVAWVQTQAHEGDNGYRSAIWISHIDDTAPRQLTSGFHRDQFPRWSPDSSTIAFVSNRPDGSQPPGDEQSNCKPLNQVWTIQVGGGEAICRTHHPHGAATPAWSPDGAQIAFIGSDTPGEDELPAPTTTGPIADERVVRRVSYRGDGRGYHERYSHIWIADLARGDARQLTTGDAFDRDPAWSPDGESLAFVSNRTAERAMRWNRSVIYTILVAGGSPVALTPDDASFDSPAWSPDGSTIAMSGHLGTHSATHAHIWTVGRDGAGLQDRTVDVDLGFGDAGMSDLSNASPAGPVWRDASTLLALASRHGETQVYGVDLASGHVTALTSGFHRISGFALWNDDLALARGTIFTPADIVRVTPDGTYTPISRANEDFLAEVALVDGMPLEVVAEDGRAIQTWIIPPLGIDLASPATHPVILQIHGGPHAMYGYSMFHEMQCMAARGYAVLFCNPRGSAGYGEEFMACTRGTWGESDMPDVMAAVDVASRLPWIDADRVGITGGSYGGYLTNWIIGHDSRFRAAVTQRCVSNFHSFVGSSDIGSTFGIYEFDGTPWSDAEKLLRYSPISYVESMTTPLLILHSEQDLRCPIEQAEQLYTALMYLGREVAFVRFPEEGHDLSRSGKPTRRLARLHHMLAWFDSHV